MLNILLILPWIHPKNQNGLFLFSNINFTIISSIEESRNLSIYDAVYSPSMPINVKKYPSIKFIFGPHFSVFPEESHVDLIKGENSVYIQPSQWAVDVWKLFSICQNLNMKPVPFAVDINKFQPIISKKERNTIFIYFKQRKIEELNFITNYLNSNSISYKLFNYSQGYQENDYLQTLQHSKMGIWIGRHESQGFGLEECLSCDIPLLVWDVTSMNQEEGYNYPDIKATVIPYWNSNCGEVFYKKEEFYDKFLLINSKIDTYKPREYISYYLSANVCEQIFIDAIP